MAILPPRHFLVHLHLASVEQRRRQGYRRTSPTSELKILLPKFLR
jgi:hypothetical protein